MHAIIRLDRLDAAMKKAHHARLERHDQLDPIEPGKRLFIADGSW
jgi:hypothetical protein